MLSVRNLHSYYGRSHTLHDVSLDLEDRGIVAVLGRNGVGKTTLLKTLMGLTDRATGEVAFRGRNIVSAPTCDRARMGFGYVPQGRQIIPDFTVRENIVLGGFAGTRVADPIPAVTRSLFPYIADNLDRRGALLSGGQQQQLAIVRALATQPDLLLMDEPTEGIQPNIVEQIEQAIVTLNRDLGIGIVLVDQNIDFARRAARTFVLMEKGRVVASGAIGELTDDLVHRHMAV
ncbi:urea ABC transporter ATP-binding subunit UrtE [Marinibacterium sp. SX1]|uniref:urea ABC transporter ATP-binding subunit UrtE n=1 Tax=Marinibacterium sp. SX1 TaxID=3388424 RepID=UPI003D183D3D